MIPQELIERALALTGKTMEDMEIIELQGEYVDYQIEDGYDERYIQTPVSVFSIEKFCYYLLSKPFLSKFYYKADRAAEGESLWDMYALFGLGISQYQEGDEEFLISLLENI